MRPRFALVLVCCLLAPTGGRGAARADSISQLGAQLEVGGGLDTNPGSEVSGPSHGNGRPRSKALGSTGVFHLSPRVLGHLASSGHRVDLDYAFTLRLPGKGDSLTLHTGLLRYQPPPLGRLGFEAILSGERSRAGDLGVSAFGLELAARYTLGRWGLTLGLGGSARNDQLGSSGSANGTQSSVLATLEARPQRNLQLSGGYTMSTLDSDFATLDETRHRVALGMHLLRGRLELTMEYGFAAARLPDGSASGGPRNDLVHDGSAALEWTLLPNLELFARAQGFVQRSDDDSSDDRLLLLAGITAHLEGTWVSHRKPTPAVQLTGRRARFHLYAPGASSAAVVGDFNDWDASAGAMQPGSRTGDFVLELELSPGRHAWSFQVDGELRAPGGVELSPDGFGGQNAILVVDE